MDYREPRYYTNKVIEIIECIGEMNDTVSSLLDYLSDDEVKEWAESNGYFDDDEDEDDEDDEEDSIYDDNPCIAEYCFNPRTNMWEAVVKDENDKVVKSFETFGEGEMKELLEDNCESLNLIRIAKVKFSK